MFLAETNNYLQTLLIGTLTPIGGVVNEAYDRMQTVLNRWLPAESRLRDSVNSIEKMSFAERRFWNTIKRAILEYFCNCTIPDGYEAILDAVDAIRITEAFQPGGRNFSQHEPETFYEIMGPSDHNNPGDPSDPRDPNNSNYFRDHSSTLPPRLEIDKTIGRIVDPTTKNDLKSLNLTDEGEEEPPATHFEVVVEEVPAVEKPRT